MRIVLTLASILLIASCCRLGGVEDLGNNIYLLEADKYEDRQVIYCTTNDVCCNSGIPIIPAGADTLTSHPERVKANDNWIIVESINLDKSKSYWVIDKNVKLDLNRCDVVDCDSILQSHVTGPMTMDDFNREKQSRNIQLHF